MTFLEHRSYVRHISCRSILFENISQVIRRINDAGGQVVIRTGFQF